MDPKDLKENEAPGLQEDQVREDESPVFEAEPTMEEDNGDIVVNEYAEPVEAEQEGEE